MADFEAFKHGAAVFPLPSALTNSLLRDADPTIFYALEFLAFVVDKYASDRFEAAAAAAGTSITATVAYTLPYNPSAYLNDQQLKFPLLALYRKQTLHNERTTEYRHDRCQCELAYVLPPMSAAQVEQLGPMLNAVKGIVDNRIERGCDPTYTPTGGSAGDIVWSESFAGVEKAELMESSFGAFEGTGDLVFPAIVMTLEMRELGTNTVTGFDSFAGGDVSIDLQALDDTKVADLVQDSTWAAPTVASISPTSGTHNGSVAVTVTGTGYRVGTTPKLYIGENEASSVVVTSATTITALTPSHNAYTTFAADVTVVNADGQDATLPAAFTFT